jgi:hypothetical protein
MSAPLDLTRAPAHDPLEIYRFRDGLYAVDLIAAAITEFDLFTKLAAKPSDLATVCRDLGTHRRPTDVMLTLFAANGFLELKKGFYSVTPLGREHLVSTSATFLGPYYASLKDRPVVKDFIVILKTDKPANWGSYKDEKPWSEAMLTDAFATSFTAAMDSRGFTLGPAARAPACSISREARASMPARSSPITPGSPPRSSNAPRSTASPAR